MIDKLLQIELPKTYVEGLIDYIPGVDTKPSWVKAQEQGYTFDKYMKLRKLLSIESMKWMYKDAFEDGELTDEEIKESENIIKKAIEEYNNM